MQEAVAQDDRGPMERRPNFLFIAVDDLRPSIGCYGDKAAVTPNLDRLAASGVLFERAYCQVAVCNPSRASLMTGLRPDTLGVWTLPIHFREAKPDAVTLPQWLRQFGYTAVSHGKIFHNPTPDPQSWSEAIRPAGTLPNAYPPGTRKKIAEAQEQLPDDDWRKDNLRGPITAAPVLEDNELIDGRRTDMALEDLDRLSKKEEPFFLAVGYIRPHLAWIAPKRYWDMVDPATLPVITDQHVTPNTPPYALSDSYELTHYMDQINFPKPSDEKRVSEADARHLMHGYYASVAYIDAQIGRLLDRVEALGLSENTVIVLWSDHGWKLGEFNGWGKMSNYEIDTRVPLIISAPGRQVTGARSSELAELVDLFPTICDLANVETPDFVEGQSLAANLLHPELQQQDAAYSQYYRRHEGEEYMGYAIRTGHYRYVQWRQFVTGEVTAEELYDHDADPGEHVNAANDAAHSTSLDLLRTQLNDSHPAHPLVMVPAIHSNPDGGRFRTSLVLRNQMECDIEVRPINAQGRRGRMRKIEPGKQLRIPARIGGVYVAESVDGTLSRILSPSYPPVPVSLSVEDSIVADEVDSSDVDEENFVPKTSGR
ncbi:MAG: sulfatase [Pirellulaceae bacterium]